MYFKLLKKDFKRKKMINLILIIFTALASAFMAAGLNDFIVTFHGLDYYADYANMSDASVIMQGDWDEDKMDSYLKKAGVVEDYEKEQLIYVDNSNIELPHPSDTKLEYTFLADGNQKYGKVFDEEGGELKLSEGEIAVPGKTAQRYHIKPGDVISLSIGDFKKRCTVKTIAKDYAWGSDIVSLTRLILSDEDYKEITRKTDYIRYLIYEIKTGDGRQLQREIMERNIANQGIFLKAIFKQAYFMNMVVAAILLLVSVIIILALFLALRFTISFTLEEDYKQIGVMKAIGLKGRRIRMLYLAKYLGIAAAGAVLGLLASYPLSGVLLGAVKQSVLLPELSVSWIPNIAAVCLTVFVIVSFCFHCTGKLKGYSAIEAIRSGAAGERYHARQKLKLNKKRRMKPVLFLAANDSLSEPKRYLILLLTFAVGIMLVITPMNLVNTMQSPSLIESFGIMRADFFYTPSENLMEYDSQEALLNRLEEMEERIREKGADSSLSCDVVYSVKAYKDAEENAIAVSISAHNPRMDAGRYAFYRGTAPRLKNEIAMTEVSADAIGARIGDIVTIKFQKDERNYILTGFYQTTNNMVGEGIRFSKEEKLPFEERTMVLTLYGDLNGETSYEQVKGAVAKLDPDGKVKTADEHLDEMMGSSKKTIRSVAAVIFPLVILMNAFITLLMVKSFLMKEKKDIALLKCIGFSNRSIRGWQMNRILLTSLAGFLCGIALSRLFDQAGLAVFRMLGLRQLTLTIKPVATYLLTPAVIVALNACVSLLGMGMVKKVRPMEINDRE